MAKVRFLLADLGKCDQSIVFTEDGEEPADSFFYQGRVLVDTVIEIDDKALANIVLDAEFKN